MKRKQKLEIREMRALSVKQPWATCIVLKGKNVENRPKITHYRGTIAIHASKSSWQESFDYLKEEYGIKLEKLDTPHGSIIGFADVVDVVTKRTKTRKHEKWFGGKYGYVLENIVILKEPVPAKGALGFWRLKGATLRKCLEQLSDRTIAKMKPFEKKS